MDFKFKKPVIFGFGGGFLILGFYFLFLTLANSFSHAVSQFSQIWYWILLLVAGFGLQVGLYFYIRESVRLKKMAGSTTVVAASGGISTGSMIACCLHHLADLLPLMGLAAVAVFLTQYQLWFIFLGILSNLIGIVIMLEIIQRYNLEESFFKKVLVYNMNQIKKVAIGVSLVLLLISFFWINNTQNPAEVSITTGVTETKITEKLNLSSQMDFQGGLSFEVTPLDFNFENLIEFEIKIDTHSGSLDFDLAKISFLKNGKGNEYQPLEWQGSPSSGHHRSGILVFPRIDSQTKKLELIIQDNYLRNFEWELK